MQLEELSWVFAVISYCVYCNKWEKSDYGEKKEDILEGTTSAKMFILKELLRDIYTIERAQKINVGSSLKLRKNMTILKTEKMLNLHHNPDDEKASAIQNITIFFQRNKIFNYQSF